MSNHSSSGPGRRNRVRTSKIDPIWWAPTLFILIAGLIALTAGAFSGKFQQFVPLTLVSDRAGLVMEDGAKVKLRGVQVGQVASIGTDVKAAQLQLKMDPGPFKYLPSNLEAEIKSTTAFGSKYVDLIVPDHPSPIPLKPGAVLHSRNVTVEVNTVFENLQSVVQALDPAKLNAILSAFAQSLRGKGERLGAGDHRREQRAADRQPPDGDDRQGLAAVRQDHCRLFRCGARHPVDPRLGGDHQQDPHRKPAVARLAAVVGGRASARPASTSSAATNPTSCGPSTCSIRPRRCCTNTRRPSPACSRARNGTSTTAAGTRWAATATR